ncbi:MAG: hypothetical protein WC824_02455 [Bacteroidota bacterium]|jgi:hypothetical protein
MNNPHEYMDSRMLHAFMDGELGGPQEEVLFQKLSASTELRAEMQDHIAIRKAIQHDIEAFTPPASASAAIFATLGFSIPASTATAASGGSLTAAALPRNMWFSAGSAILATVAAVMLYLQFPLAFDNIGNMVERVVSSPSGSLVIEESAPLGDLNVIPSTPLQHQTAQAALTTEFAPATMPAAVQVRDVTPRDMQLLAEAVRAPETAGNVRADQVRFYDLIPNPDGITFYARNVALRSDPSPTVVSQSDPWFSNMNLGAMYAIADHHAIGIEGGREPFSQHFFGNENGVRVRYEQNPLAYWATAVYQFTGDALLPHVHPFAQLQAGGAFDLGPLARATLGFKFKPFDRIAVVVGAEGSVLMYRFQNNWFSTNKVGMTYGVSYEF